MGLVDKKDPMKAVQSGQAPEEQPVRVSRTQKKKAALSMQDLGKRLVKLSDEQLEQLDLPEDVLAAVKDAKTIKKLVPLHRQIQYIGSLMRRYDPAPVWEYLQRVQAGK